MARTDIYALNAEGEERLLGYVEEGVIFAGHPPGRAVGRAAEGRLFRATAHDERELGKFTAAGRIRSHGLFEGGDLGWVDPDGVVVQAGLIFGEEEVGRVEGPQPGAAAAALLLIFLPDEAEAGRRRR